MSIIVPNRSVPSIAVLCLLSAGLMGCGSGVGDDPQRVGDYYGQEVMPPFAAADFTLTDTNGQPYHFKEQTDGAVALLFFGYTYCPDICPVHMANLAAVLKRLPFDTARRVKVVFVSVDPDRDTPERIREWLGSFDGRFVGLSGPLDRVNQIQQSLLMPTTVIVPEPEGDYTVGHGAAVLAIIGDSVRVRYPFGTRQRDWSHDLPKLVATIPEVKGN